MPTADVSDLTEDAILERAAACAVEQQRAGVELLRLAYAWAIAHPPQSLDPRQAGRPGRERAAAYAGPGAPEVAEFAAAELGARIGRTSHHGRKLMAAALDLHHRLPTLWSRVQDLEVRDSYAIFVAERTRDLTAAQAGWVDTEVAESADGRLPWTRFEALVEGKIATADPLAQREREQRAARARFAKPVGLPAHGMASFLIRADVATIDLIESSVARLAAGLTQAMPEDPKDERRVEAVRMLVSGSTSPSEIPSPHVELIIHLAPDQHTDPSADDPSAPLPRVARLEGQGPVTESWIRDVLGPQARFTVRPVVDPLHQTPVDAYEIPTRLRRAVRLLSPADVFPWGANTTGGLQIDHTEAHADGGPTAIGNLGPLTTGHHRLKTHGRWQVRQPFPGIHLWRDPHGQIYLVDHTGTRALPPRQSSDAPRPRVDLTFFSGNVVLAA